MTAQEPPLPPPMPPPRARTTERLAIRTGRMFDGKSDTLKRQQVILIEGTRIVQVGPAKDVPIPPDAEVLDLSNATVLPGLIDGHTHVFTSGGSGAGPFPHGSQTKEFEYMVKFA